MAKVLKELPDRKTNYPWSNWMNDVDPDTGSYKVWKLRQGNDFTCTPGGMAQNLYYKGKTTKGKAVTVRGGRADPDGRKIVIFQFRDE